MDQHIGLDVSLKDTSISVRENGKRVWRGKCPSDPKLLAELIRKRAPHAKRVVFETGPLSVWFYHALTAEGLPAICIDARHAKAALDMAANKTDANDADGLAHLAEVGFYREVRVKGFDSMLMRTLISGRRQLMKMRVQMSNQRCSGIRWWQRPCSIVCCTMPSSSRSRAQVTACAPTPTSCPSTPERSPPSPRRHRQKDAGGHRRSAPTITGTADHRKPKLGNFNPALLGKF